MLANDVKEPFSFPLHLSVSPPVAHVPHTKNLELNTPIVHAGVSKLTYGTMCGIGDFCSGCEVAESRTLLHR